MELTQFEKTGTNEAKLTVKVTAEEFGRAVDAAIREKGKKLTVPGFRKGKAPKALLEKAYGREYFYQDAVNETYGYAYDAAVKQADIVPVDRADIELVECSEDGYTFTATVTVKPEVKVKDYKGIKVTKNVVTVSDEQVDAELNRMLERNARYVDVEGRPAQNGDIAEIDYEGFKDDVAFEGGKGEHYDLTLGSGSFIPGFEEQVCGHNVGDEFDVNVSFPEDYPSEELKGAPVVFKCKLHAIKSKELPAADDDFAKDTSEFDTLDELKADIKKKLEDNAEKAADAEVENKIYDTIIANMKAEIPQVMFEHKIDDMVRDFEIRLSQQGLDLDMYLSFVGMDKAAFRKTFEEQAQKTVKLRLALEKIAQLENLTVSDDEVLEELKKMSETYKVPVEQLMNVVSPETLKTDMVVTAASKLVKEKAVIK